MHHKLNKAVDEVLRIRLKVVDCNYLLEIGGCLHKIYQRRIGKSTPRDVETEVKPWIVAAAQSPGGNYRGSRAS